MVLLEGIELSTSPLPRECSTTELQQLIAGFHRGFVEFASMGVNPERQQRTAVRKESRGAVTFSLSRCHHQGTEIPGMPCLITDGLQRIRLVGNLP